MGYKKLLKRTTQELSRLSNNYQTAMEQLLQQIDDLREQVTELHTTHETMSDAAFVAEKEHKALVATLRKRIESLEVEKLLLKTTSANN